MLLADDSLIVREGLRALIGTADDLEVVGVAGGYDELIARADELEPDVIVSDIRMPPTFQSEGIEAAHLIRRRHPGTGVVVLSHHDDPEYALALLADGAAGYAYLLKDRVAEGDQLARAIRTVSIGGTALDPKVVEALVQPVRDQGLVHGERELLLMVAEGRSVKAIAATLATTPADAADSVEKLFMKLSRQAGRGHAGALRNLRLLHQAIVSREALSESLSRMLPGGIAERMRRGGQEIGAADSLFVTVLMSDVRGYSRIAQEADPSRLARQISEHRAAASHAVIAEGGTVMQFVGDAVMAVFGAPHLQPDHADRALCSALALHRAQAELNRRWQSTGWSPFEVGVGLSTGLVAAALLGSEERLEYSVVGDAVNLTQRLQQLAAGGEIVLSEATYAALAEPPLAERLRPGVLPGRDGKVTAYRISSDPTGTAGQP